MPASVFLATPQNGYTFYVKAYHDASRKSHRLIYIPAAWAEKEKSEGKGHLVSEVECVRSI